MSSGVADVYPVSGFQIVSPRALAMLVSHIREAAGEFRADPANRRLGPENGVRRGVASGFQLHGVLLSWADPVACRSHVFVREGRGIGQKFGAALSSTNGVLRFTLRAGIAIRFASLEP